MRLFLVWLLTLAAVAAIGLTAFTFATRSASTCQAVEEVKTVIRTILVNARAEVLSNPDITALQRDRAVKFYDRNLALAEPHSC